MIWKQRAFVPSPFLIFPFSIIPFFPLLLFLVVFPKMPWCVGWWTHGIKLMVMLLPYSILTHFVDRGFLRWRVQDCASGFRGSMIYILVVVPCHHALLTVTHIFSQKIRGIQFDPWVLMFPKYPLTPYFVFHLLRPCM
jgi:hypothetical protein